MPTPFHRVVVLFGLMTRPKRNRNAPSTGQSSRPRSVVLRVLGARDAFGRAPSARRRSASSDAMTPDNRDSDARMRERRVSAPLLERWPRWREGERVRVTIATLFPYACLVVRVYST